VFRYYSLGVDTAMLGGLYATLCHAFLVFFNFSFKTIFVPQILTLQTSSFRTTF